MDLQPAFYIDRAGRARVSIRGHDSIGFQREEEAREVYRRIDQHAPTTAKELKAVTGLNEVCVEKLLRKLDG